jgi:hypothetical protein
MTKSDQVFGEEADDQAQAGPRVHPPVEQPQLGRAGLELQEAQRGAETTAASGLVPPPSRAICRRIARARRSTGFTSGHASWPQVVEVMERIRSRTRTQGSRRRASR